MNLFIYLNYKNQNESVPKLITNRGMSGFWTFFFFRAQNPMPSFVIVPRLVTFDLIIFLTTDSSLLFLFQLQCFLFFHRRPYVFYQRSCRSGSHLTSVQASNVPSLVVSTYFLLLGKYKYSKYGFLCPPDFNWKKKGVRVREGKLSRIISIIIKLKSCMLFLFAV